MRADGDKIAGSLFDISLLSNGSVTYNELKLMSPRELNIVTKRLESYLKAKAKAGGGLDNLVE